MATINKRLPLIATAHATVLDLNDVLSIEKTTERKYDENSETSWK